ncbi:MAG: hypothetical protein QW594_02135 [Candidatus Woesearchaeota archaeon]
MSFVLVTATSSPLQITATPLTTTIAPDETASVLLTLENPSQKSIDIYITFPTLDWVGYTDPLTDYTFTLKSNAKKSTTLKFFPSSTLQPGAYNIRTRINDITQNLNYDFLVPVYLKPAVPVVVEQLPALRVRLETPYEIDPRYPWTYKAKIENLNQKHLQQVQVEIVSNHVQQQREITLEPNEATEQVFVTTLDPLTSPTEGLLTITVRYTQSNRTYTWQDTAAYKIFGYTAFKEDRSVQKQFLKTTEHITISNEGNRPDTYLLKVQTSPIKRIFTIYSAVPEYMKTAQGEYSVWAVQLNPLEEATITLSSNYRPILYFFVVMLTLFFLYYMLRSPVLIKKEVIKLATKEGGISNIKIIIQIKNRTSHTFENLRIIEKLPTIVSIEEQFEIGSIVPVSIHKSTEKGNIVKWEITHLDAYEERIITYKIESKVSILGGMSLPPTLLKFQDKKGRELTIQSNRLNLEL